MGSGGVAIAALPTVICLKVPFSDGLGGGYKPVGQLYEKLVGLNLLITNTHIPVFWIQQTHTIPIV